jgi:hypothetical protein
MFETAGAPDADFSIDGLVTTMPRSVTRPTDIRCPRCPQVSPDETTLLPAAGLAQGGEGARLGRVLRTTLLSAQGAECAIDPLGAWGHCLL